ncbi:AraC family transcriptional regulator [Flavobacterium restrictum]|uniref:Helix-turn-helix transcriptional regulator n=1 Tax=Flavobacterium restrictum TaxID=2594428 RepID=A0A553DWD6_9FLAO|nr:AraC family transcriptional regulator [Flavobacterium restrictum]TRX37104.1 helix-turn-helix transcriptional regulator [Flavobacterium restrictum]
MNPFISVFSIFFALLLGFYNWNINRNSIYLSGFIIVFAIYALIHYFLLLGDSVFWLAVLYNNTAPICYLAGPFLYFYVKGTLFDKSKPQKKDWFHLIPAAINLVSVTPYLLTSFDHKLDLAQKLLNDTMAAKTITVGLYPNIINALARPILLCIYCTACAVMIYRFSSKMNTNDYIPKKQSRIVLKWLWSFVTIIAATVITFTYMTYLFWGETNPDVTKLNTGVPMYVVGFGLLLIPLSLIFFPEILYGIPEAERNKKKYSTQPEVASEESIELKNKGQNETKTEEITLTKQKSSANQEMEPKFIELSQSILVYIKESEIYLNPNFSMEELSREMNVPKHHLYYCFNSVMNLKLTKIRAELRVEYAKKLIEQGFLDTLTLDAVASKAGFSSRSSFQSTFKDEVGCSPGDYLKILA